MSRAMNLKMTIADVKRGCEASGVAISAIESLPSGDTHLVCITGDGASEMRRQFAKHLVEGSQKRFPTSIPPSRW